MQVVVVVAGDSSSSSSSSSSRGSNIEVTPVFQSLAIYLDQSS